MLGQVQTGIAGFGSNYKHDSNQNLYKYDPNQNLTYLLISFEISITKIKMINANLEFLGQLYFGWQAMSKFTITKFLVGRAQLKTSPSFRLH